MSYRVEDFEDQIDELSIIVGDGKLNELEEEFIVKISQMNASAPLSHAQSERLQEIYNKAYQAGWTLDN